MADDADDDAEGILLYYLNLNNFPLHLIQPF